MRSQMHPVVNGCRAAGRSGQQAERRRRHVVNLPDLASQGDDVGRVADHLERGRKIQTVHDDGEAAISIHFHLRAGARQCRGTFELPALLALRQGVELAAAAEFHVDEEPGTRGTFRDRGRSWPE